MSKRSGLGERARPLGAPDKYLKGVLGPASEVPSEKDTEQLPEFSLAPEEKTPKRSPRAWEGKPDSSRMVPKTWHLPEELARRFDNFLAQKCRPGTRGVVVIRQILDDFLKKQGF